MEQATPESAGSRRLVPSRRRKVVRTDVDPPCEWRPAYSFSTIVLLFILAIRQRLLPPPSPTRLVTGRPQDHLRPSVPTNRGRQTHRDAPSDK